MNYINKILSWIMNHKLFVFFYLPLIMVFLLGMYTGFVYLGWTSDKEKALDKLKKYKMLIDQTEDLKAGYVYKYSQVDLSAKVVDIPTRIYDRNNEIIGEFFEQKREIVPFNHLPKYLINAVVASEDREFYKHKGVSFKGIMRAMGNNIVHLRVVQGGSTITQQLAKVLFTDMERTIRRKIYEAFCAVEIEKRYDKQDIILMYLNLIYFGNGAYGVESASKMFFGKTVQELNETECAMIVGTISNPLIYSPLTNLNNSIKKTRRIMKSMVDAGYIKKGRADYQFKKFLQKWNVKFDSKNRAESSLIGSFLYSSYRINRAPFFNEQIRRILVEKFGEDVVKKGGLSVYTTIDGARQDQAYKYLKDGIARQRQYMLKRLSKKTLANPADVEGSLISLNPYTGEIICYVGGYSFSAENQLDCVAQINRQPGSSFKPIIYTAAIESKEITPSTIMVDEKTKFERNYMPKNYDGKYHGRVIIRYAIAQSINVVAVKVLKAIGYNRVMDIIQKSLGLSDSDMNKRFGRTLSLALGTYEISPLENAILHSVIHNGGDYIKPYGIKYVKDYNGNVVWSYEEDIKSQTAEMRKKLGKIIDPIACAITVDMMKGVFQEGGTAAFTVKKRSLLFPIAGKTGTTSKYYDAWIAGYTPDMVTIVWLGNKKGSITLGGGRGGAVIAVPVWINFIQSIYRDHLPGNFLTPDAGISRQTICLDSGMVPREEGLCPRVVRDQLYYSGTEPGDYCPLHQRVVEQAAPTPTEKR